LLIIFSLFSTHSATSTTITFFDSTIHNIDHKKTSAIREETFLDKAELLFLNFFLPDPEKLLSHTAVEYPTKIGH